MQALNLILSFASLISGVNAFVEGICANYNQAVAWLIVTAICAVCAMVTDTDKHRNNYR